MMGFSRKARVFSSIGAIATVLVSGVACAQGPAAADPQAGATLDEIVVTAQMRSENVQDVPAAISVVSGDVLASSAVVTSTEIFQLVPNLTVNKTFDLSNPRIYLRGVGSSDFNANSANPIGVYVDEVYISDSSALQFQLFDTERVEVLRGPQGTLYGRNTTAGAINYISRQPSSDTNGYLSARYGNFDEFSLQGAVGLPITDSLSVRVAANHYERDNYMFNSVTNARTKGARSDSGRIMVHYEGANNFTIDANVHAGEGQIGQFAQHRGVASTASGGACTASAALAGQCVDFLGYRDTDGDPFRAAFDRSGVEKVTSYGGYLKVGVDLGFARLLSITAYDDIKRRTGIDNDVSPANTFTINYANDSEQFTQELRLTSPGGQRLNWIAGAYFYDFRIKADNDFDVFRALRPVFGFNPQPAPGQPLVAFVTQDYAQRTRAYAVFARGDYAFTDALKLTLGIRYTKERARFVENLAFTEPQFAIPLFVNEKRRFSDSNISGNISLDYQVTDDALLYASVARGFKSGGFNGGVVFNPRQLDPYDSETLTSYELGLKSDLFGKRLRFNLSGFYYAYQDLQLFTLVNNNNVPTSILDNAGRARVYGVEAELTARPVTGLTIGASLGLLATKLTEFITTGGVDFTDNKLPGAPSMTANVSVAYSIPVTGSHALTLRADSSYRGSSFYTVANLERLRQKSRILSNARIEFGPDSNTGWQIALYARNIFRKKYEVAIQDFSDFGFDYVVPGDPRTYGAELLFKF
ncbi:TonB-dependent receptor [Sphingobium algorifonticola]|nr:TonB-dependent receptor [Sphingobium algorifonticola]